MQNILKTPRNGCALQGSLQTLQEIKGVIPVIHSTSGCAYQNFLANKASGFGKSFISTEELPGTDMQERHIIFGGASRLREQIKNTIKVIDGKLYVVLNSCPSAMVGDDVDAMVRESQEQGEKVIDGLSAGFHGDVHYGYSQILTEVFQNLSKVDKSEVNKEKNLVNIFGILPQKDLYYKGDLEEITRILSAAGIKVNQFFAYEGGSEQLVNAKNASLNIVFSRWGQAPADKLEELYSIPTLTFDALPFGFDESADFIKLVSEKLGLDFAPAQDFLAKEAARLDYYFSSLKEVFYQNHLNKEVDIVADEAVAKKYARFLKKYFNSKINTVIITDFLPNDDNPESAKTESLKDLAEKIFIAQDQSEIEKILSFTESSLILGSSLENKIASKKAVPNLVVSYPSYKNLILNKSHAGIIGAIQFAEDFVRAVL
ncbi:MAG: hydrogenase [Treponema sp.]|nr:hydrogenase [Treponema sp.]